MSDATCMRAGIEMTKEEWFSLPLELRQRYWRDTDWGNRPPSEQMIEEIMERYLIERRKRK